MKDATDRSISGAVTYDAVVLAGGRARRMDGVDKAMLSVGGRPLLWHALDAVGTAETVVIVGPQRPVARDDVVWAREEPPHGGPVAGRATPMLAPSPAGVEVSRPGDVPQDTRRAGPCPLPGLRRPTHDGSIVDGCPSARRSRGARAWNHIPISPTTATSASGRGCSRCSCSSASRSQSPR